MDREAQVLASYKPFENAKADEPRLVKVAHVKWPRHNLDYGFMYEIDSLEALMDYWERVRFNQIRAGFADAVNSCEFLTAIGKGGGTHASTRDGMLLANLVHFEQYKEKPRSLPEIMGDVNDRTLKSMLRGIHEWGAIYINGNGGYMPLHAEMEIVERRELDKFVLPGAKVKITRWPGGRHCYVTVGGESVIWAGANKWDTEAEAMTVAKKWAKQHNIRLDEEN